MIRKQFGNENQRITHCIFAELSDGRFLSLIEATGLQHKIRLNYYIIIIKFGIYNIISINKFQLAKKSSI